MGVIYITIIVSTLIAVVFLIAFLWSVKDGQYEDDKSPAIQILLEDEEKENQEN